jgi:hypothetical protein
MRAALGTLQDLELKVPELRDVHSRNLFKGRNATVCQVHFDDASVPLALELSDESPFYGTLHQPHDRVVPFLQELREFGDGCPAATRVAGHSQQELVLLRCDATGARDSLAEAEETADPIAKPCQSANRLGSGRMASTRSHLAFHTRTLYHNAI